MTHANAQPSRARSIVAVAVGLVSIVVLSLATDQVFHVLNVYPPWGQPMREPGDNLLALGYRSVYTVLGGYLTARLAPRNPMRYVTILAVTGFILGAAGAIGTIPLKLGPVWYPILLALTGPIFTLLGGRLHKSTTT
jgi:hypothetical protein